MDEEAIKEKPEIERIEITYTDGRKAVKGFTEGTHVKVIALYWKEERDVWE